MLLNRKVKMERLNVDFSQIYLTWAHALAQQLVMDCHAGNKDKHVALIEYGLLQAGKRAAEAVADIVVDACVTGEDNDVDG